MPAYLDSALHPELVARQVRVEEETAVTNRLYALAEFLKNKPIFPTMGDGQTDARCFHAWREAWMHANDAVAEIAEASIGWAAEKRSEGSGE